MDIKRDNALSLIRFLAAVQVMIGHLIIHLKLPISSFANVAIHFYNGVPIFYVMSGFLVWISISKSQSFSQYIKKRFWRIYPELWIGVLVEIVVLVILYNKIVFKDFILFIFGQITIFQFWTPDSLKGYGVGSPNGILGTISIMIQFYIIAWPLYKLIKKTKKEILILLFVFSFLISFILNSLLSGSSYSLLTKIFGQTIIKHFWLFMIGIIIAQFKDQIVPILKKCWYIFLGLSFICYYCDIDIRAGYSLFWSLFLVMGLIGFAYKYPYLAIKTDISYGLFIYHMTVVNIFVTFNLMYKWEYAVVVSVISIILAIISTIIMKKIHNWLYNRKAFVKKT